MMFSLLTKYRWVLVVTMQIHIVGCLYEQVGVSFEKLIDDLIFCVMLKECFQFPGRLLQL